MEDIKQKEIYEIYLPKNEKIISNALAEEFIKSKFTITETAIIFVLICFIGDKNNKYNLIELSYSDFEKITQIDKHYIIKAVKPLIDKGIIIKKQIYRKNYWGIADKYRI